MHITFVFFIFNVKFNENILEVLYYIAQKIMYKPRVLMYIIMSMNSK